MNRKSLVRTLILFVFLSQMVYAQDKINSSEINEVSQTANNFLQDWLLRKSSKKSLDNFSDSFYITCFSPNEEFTNKTKWIDSFSKSIPQVRKKFVKRGSHLSEIIFPLDFWVEKITLLDHKNEKFFKLGALPSSYFDQFETKNGNTCDTYGETFKPQTLTNYQGNSKNLYMVTFGFKVMKEAKVMLLLAKINKEWKIISFEIGTY